MGIPISGINLYTQGEKNNLELSSIRNSGISDSVFDHLWSTKGNDDTFLNLNADGDSIDNENSSSLSDLFNTILSLFMPSSTEAEAEELSSDNIASLLNGDSASSNNSNSALTSDNIASALNGDSALSNNSNSALTSNNIASALNGAASAGTSANSATAGSTTGMTSGATPSATPANSAMSGSAAGATKSTATETIDSDLAQKLDSKLGSGFSAKVEEVAKNLKCNPNDLLAMMYSESGLDPKAGVGSGGALGLGQFMPSTLSEMGMNANEVGNMSAIEQLDVVEKYIQTNKDVFLSSDAELDAGTLYALNFLPAVANKESLCSTSDSLSWAYSANSPLDIDGNGDISKTDLTNRLNSKYQEMCQYI